MLLGVIADDFTGATDLANTLVRQGMRVIQMIGVPGAADVPDDVDAVVVALKSRSTPAGEAVAESLAALGVLREAGAHQVLFKYCSTFDSTDEGNIGPVADALADALSAPMSIVCPAFPETGRTIFKGHLFVGDRLLNESGMENHPLNPMRDADLVRVMARQSRSGVGLVPCEVVEAGADAIAAALAALEADGKRFAVVDAIHDRQLFTIGEAIAGHALVTGGSGIGLGLPENFRRAGLLPKRDDADALEHVDGDAAVLSGSCSIATRGQIEQWTASRPSCRMDVRALAADHDAEVARVLAFVAELPSGVAPLIYTSDDPDAVAAVQAELGREAAGAIAEQGMAAVARALVSGGVRRLVVAGGETSGAVVGALGVRALRIGPQIDPGVPWTSALADVDLALALKSGNFGARDFFAKALTMLDA